MTSYGISHLCVCNMCVSMCHHMYVEVSSLILICDSPGLNSGYQIWWQALLPTKPLCQPAYHVFKNNIFKMFSLKSFKSIGIIRII